MVTWPLCCHPAGEHGDLMESYFLSETAKYLYLMFSSAPALIDYYVLSTEGHLMPPLADPRSLDLERLRQGGGGQEGEEEEDEEEEADEEWEEEEERHGRRLAAEEEAGRRRGEKTGEGARELEAAAAQLGAMAARDGEDSDEVAEALLASLSLGSGGGGGVGGYGGGGGGLASPLDGGRMEALIDAALTAAAVGGSPEAVARATDAAVAAAASAVAAALDGTPAGGVRGSGGAGAAPRVAAAAPPPGGSAPGGGQQVRRRRRRREGGANGGLEGLLAGERQLPPGPVPDTCAKVCTPPGAEEQVRGRIAKLGRMGSGPGARSSPCAALWHVVSL